jgi:branched-chain amino acid transport system permease protein
LAARRLLAAAGLALLAAPLVLSPYARSLAIAVLADVCLASAWALFSGPTGYLSLATGAFFGAGAYASALTVGRLAWPLPVVAGAAVGAGLALIVGILALRLRGPYFAIFTFGLAEMAKHLLIWFETRIAGTVGRLVLAPPGPWTLYYTVLALAAAALAVAALLRRSRWGDALIAIGADEERAETLGVNTRRAKIAGFALSAFFAGALGAAMAVRWTYIEPNSVFNPFIGFQTVLIAMVGGAHTLIGPLVSSVVFSVLTEFLRLQFPYLFLILLGLLLILLVLYLPGGLASLWPLARARVAAFGARLAALEGGSARG